MHLELEFHPRLTVKATFLSKACISQLFIQNSLQWYHLALADEVSLAQGEF